MRQFYAWMIVGLASACGPDSEDTCWDLLDEPPEHPQSYCGLPVGEFPLERPPIESGLERLDVVECEEPPASGDCNTCVGDEMDELLIGKAEENCGGEVLEFARGCVIPNAGGSGLCCYNALYIGRCDPGGGGGT